MMIGQGVGAQYCLEHSVHCKPVTPNEKHMGSTIFGSVNSIRLIGIPLPQDIHNRAGFGRVRSGDRI